MKVFNLFIYKYITDYIWELFTFMCKLVRNVGLKHQFNIGFCVNWRKKSLFYKN